MDKRLNIKVVSEKAENAEKFNKMKKLLLFVTAMSLSFSANANLIQEGVNVAGAVGNKAVEVAEDSVGVAAKGVGVVGGAVAGVVEYGVGAVSNPGEFVEVAGNATFCIVRVPANVAIFILDLPVKFFRGLATGELNQTIPFVPTHSEICE